MGEAAFIGLDLGTGTVKAVALDADDQVRAVTQRKIPTTQPAADRAEQDAAALAEAAIEALAEIVGSVGEVAGVGLSGAMHSLLAIDQNNQPLAPATTWADQRHCAGDKSLDWNVEASWRTDETGCPRSNLYHPRRLVWWKRCEPKIYQAAAKWVSLTDYLAYRLTGAWATSVGLASATGLFDVRRLRWFDAMLDALGLRVAQLPRVIGPTQAIGNVQPDLRRRIGLTDDASVYAGGSDGAMANLGAGGMDGRVVVTIGTSAAARRITPTPTTPTTPAPTTPVPMAIDESAQSPLSHDLWCYAIDRDHMLRGGAMNNGGNVLDHLLAQCRAEDTPLDIERLLEAAASEPAGAGGLRIVPFAQPERGTPWSPAIGWCESGGGDDITLGRRTRATLEGLAACLGIIVEQIEQENAGPTNDAPTESPIWLTGGVTRSKFWSQLVADVMGRAVRLVDLADSSAIGAAMTARAATQGEALAELRTTDQSQSDLTPSPANRAVYAQVREDIRATLNAQDS